MLIFYKLHPDMEKEKLKKGENHPGFIYYSKRFYLNGEEIV